MGLSCGHGYRGWAPFEGDTVVVDDADLGERDDRAGGAQLPAAAVVSLPRPTRPGARHLLSAARLGAAEKPGPGGAFVTVLAPAKLDRWDRYGPRGGVISPWAQ